MSRTLVVGQGGDYSSLSAAVAAAESGDTVYVLGGVYENDHVVIRKSLTITGDGTHPHFTSSGLIGNRKGMIVVEGDHDLEVRNLVLEGARVRDNNGAGIRFQGDNLTVDDVKFINNQMAILAGRNHDHDREHTVSVTNSFFEDNGGYFSGNIGHGVYVQHFGRLEVTDSTFTGTRVGHHIKSRAWETVVENNSLIDGDGNSSYSVDVPNLGEASIVGNHIEQSVAGSRENPNMINYGGEARAGQLISTKPGTLHVEGNVFVNIPGSGAAVINRSDRPVELVDNAFYNVGTRLSGPGTEEGGRVLDAPPDTNAPSDVSVFLVDTKTDTVIQTLKDGASLDGALLDATDVSIVVQATGIDVGSVALDYQDGLWRQLENLEPYALFGDARGDYNASKIGALFPDSGEYTLDVTIFSGGRGTGAVVERHSLRFAVNDPAANESDPVPNDSGRSHLDLWLIDADTDARLAKVEDGVQIPRSALGDAAVTLAAYVKDDSPWSGHVSRTELDLDDGLHTRIERFEPYSLFGDGPAAGIFNGGVVLEPGAHDFSITLSGNGAGAPNTETLLYDFFIV